MNSPKNLLRTFLFPAFFITGATGLVYQVLWERLLVLSFGYTIYSVSIVITAFMGGLAIGSFIGGIIADKVENALIGYGAAELGIGVIAILTYPLLTGLPETIAGLREALSIPYSGFSPWVFLISAGILAAPTILMGLTLPFLAKILTGAEERAATDIGALYALNTLGAALGAVLTGFVLISYLGVHTTLLAAAGVNIIVGLAALALKGQAPSRVKKEEYANAGQAGPILKEPIFWAFGVSGFVALSCEVVWIRLLTPYLENSTYAFSLVLGIFLLGIAFGGFAGRVAASRTEESAYGFGMAQLFVGLFTGIGFILLFPFIGYYHQVLPAHGVLVKIPAILLKESLWLVLILIPSTFFMGAGFPFVAKWAGKDFKRLGTRTGKLYASNTIGSIVGALAGGFLLLPVLGTRDSIALLVALNFVNGCFMIYAGRSKGLNLKKGLVAGMGIALAVFVFVLKSQDNPNLFALNSAYNDSEVIAYREDPDVNVALLQDGPPGRARQLNINLREVSGTGVGITPWMTHLPILFFEDGRPLRMLNIGLGIGNTFTTALEHPNIRIEVLELVPSVVDLFTEFNPRAKEALSNSRGRVIVGDGRNYLLSTKERYDIVLIDPTPPLYGTGAVNLYTEDFFNVVKSKLTPDGMLVLRIPISADKNSIKLLLRTAMEAFTDVSVWMPPMNGAGFTVVASERSYRIGDEELLKRFTASSAYNVLTPAVREAVVKFRPVLVGEKKLLLKDLAHVPVVTDDRPYLEFPLFRKY